MFLELAKKDDVQKHWWKVSEGYIAISDAAQFLTEANGKNKNATSYWEEQNKYKRMLVDLYQRSYQEWQREGKVVRYGTDGDVKIVHLKKS